MKIKRNMIKRAFAVVLAVCMAVSMVPMMPAQALAIESGNFNPGTGDVVINFDLQYNQLVDVEVLVNGVHFGFLLKGYDLSGYDGDINPGPLCDVYPVQTDSADANSVTAQPHEVEVLPQEGEGPGHHTIIWNGRIDGYPIADLVDADDKYELTIRILGKGYPALNTSCTDDIFGHTCGDDYTWTRQHAGEVTIELDYLTILTADEFADLLIALEYGFSCTFLDYITGQFGNWFSLDKIAKLLGFDDVAVGDPVHIIDGSYVMSYTDIKLEGAIPLPFMRIYNSRGWGDSLGAGFTHLYDLRLVEIGRAHV